MLTDVFKPVTGSADLDRILALPRRKVNPELYVEPVTRALRKPGIEIDESKPHRLNPTQAWTLYELARTGGILGPIGVGHGKTGLDLLAPLVVPGCKIAVLLVPSTLREAISHSHQLWGRNFIVPNLFGGPRFNAGLPTIFVVSYDQLSRESGAELLEKLAPDLIIADEAHLLRHKDAARTRRVLRYLAAHRGTRFCAWSGTLTSNSIKNYAHLSAFALKDKSPLPLHSGVLEDWSGAIDANARDQRLPGALRRLCDGNESVRQGYFRRLTDSYGVVATKDASVNCSIYFLERKIEVPANINAALDVLRSDGDRPDGERLVEASHVYRCARELASGFYYKWVFPRGESRATIDHWKEVRRNWHSELREELKRNRPLMDSPLLLCRAAIRHRNGYDGPLPKWDSEYFEEWSKVKNTVKPQTEAVWLADFLLEDSVKYANETGAILWYEHRTWEQRLKSLGFPAHGADTPGPVVEGVRGPMAASIESHGTGRNLQHFHSSNLIANYPNAHAAWEQLIGRTHRQGQKADEVIVTVYLHTEELRDALKRALEYAKYQQETLGSEMKLCKASFSFQLEE